MLSELTSVGMVLDQALYHRFQGDDACGGKHPYLAHAASQHLSLAVCLCNEVR
jgi:hypothetical protein